jgi:hypothetical protein
MMVGEIETRSERDRAHLATLLAEAIEIADRVDPIVAIHVETALAMLRPARGEDQR